jgi:ABC-type multidrug transport system ATPase subunit
LALLDIRNLRKRYRNGTLANDGISLSVARGEVFGLLGPNGAGKTTLVKQVMGLLRPTEGSIYIDSIDVVAAPGAARRMIGFLPQAQFNTTSIRVVEMIESIGKLRGLGGREARDRAGALVDELGLREFARTTMMEASGGVRRLAGFATAVVAPAPLLVLDEPTNDIDPIRRSHLWKTIQSRAHDGAAVLLVTHNLAEAERVFDRVAIIGNGRILREGTTASLRGLVSDRLRLEVSAAGPLDAHPALLPEPDRSGAFLFDQRDLDAVTAWLAAGRATGAIADFRIGPPTLDEVYTAALAEGGL